MSRTFSKEADATLDYTINYGRWLPRDDRIVASQWEIEQKPGDETPLAQVDHTFADRTTTIMVTGGKENTRYRLTNHITTLGGRVDERVIFLMIRNR
jgi:hypothetical protein